MEEKEEKKKFGNYLGIVIQNNDPDQYGRVKVFIPHLTPLSDSSWLDGQSDKSIDSIRYQLHGTMDYYASIRGTIESIE